MDLLPTFADFVGAKAPTDRVIDGRNIRTLLVGETDARTPHEAFFYHQGNLLRAVRSGPWKLFVTGELYNLNNDIGEKTDVARQHPDIVGSMKKRLAAFEAHLAAQSRPVGRPSDPRTILPRPGADGAEAHRPTLAVGKKSK